MKQTIARIALPTPLYRLFDYLLPGVLNTKQLQPGIRIKVTFGKQRLIGLLIATSDKTDIPETKLKPIIEILDTAPILTKEILSLCQWASDYYHHPLGTVLAYALPALLRQGKPAQIKRSLCWQATTINKNNKLDTLKKSPKQAALLNYLRSLKTPIAQTTLIQQGYSSAIIKGLEQKKLIEQKIPIATKNDVLQKQPILNTAQQEAIKKIAQTLKKFGCFLLEGITGSGKTEVYLQVIQQVLQQKKQALVLVPEIGLTPQTIQRFEQRFQEKVICLHSGLNNQERLNGWLMAKSDEARIIIGTRSAIFTPCKNLGIIIIDEEHDLSFKQQDNFRYSAKNLAIIRAQKNKIPVVLGSATPSLESLHNIKTKSFQILTLPERAGNAIHPYFHNIDIRNEKLEHGLSKPLILKIKQHLLNSNQVLLFLNRRGYAPTLMCHACGWIASCQRCDANMTLHQQPSRLHCHHCDSLKKIPAQCPQCNSLQLQDIGVGTERLELALKKLFPDTPITRIDRDTTRRKQSIQKLLDQIHQGKKQILVGTQMIAKGHHFPNVTLVGIINADAGFFSTDFRATERMGQLLIQVAGRAGRAEKPGEVFIQTHHPDHPLLRQLTSEGYAEFAKLLLKERKESLFPPYSHLALIRSASLKKELPEKLLKEIKTLAAEQAAKTISLFGPVSSPMPRRKGHHHAQLLLQSKDRLALQKLLATIIPFIENMKLAKQAKWSIDVDPMEMY